MNFFLLVNWAQNHFSFSSFGKSHIDPSFFNFVTLNLKFAFSIQIIQILKAQLTCMFFFTHSPYDTCQQKPGEREKIII